MSRFSTFVGLRYAGSRSGTQLVSFISWISIAGLTIGVGLLLTVLSVMNGFDRELQQRILSILPHGAVYNRAGIADWESLREQLLENPQIIGAAPFVELQAMLSTRGGQEVQPVVLYGIDVKEEQQVSVLPRFVDSDAMSEFSQGQSGLLLGQGVADTLGVEKGDKISVLVPSGSGSATSPRLRVFTVSGLIRSDTELDHSLALIPLDAASALSNTPGRVSGLRVKLRDLFAAPEVIYGETSKLPYGYYGSDWTRTHGNLFQAIHMSKSLVGLLLFMVVAIAAFNVVSTLVMVVVDKEADIAILKTLGASRSSILAIFVLHGCIIGGIGTFLGVLLGVGGSLLAGDIYAAIQEFFHVSLLNSSIYPVSYLPSQIRAADFVLVVCLSLLLSAGASLYPAWRASRIAPAEALRFE